MRAAFNNSHRTLHLVLLIILPVLMASGLSEAQVFLVTDHHPPSSTLPEKPVQEFHCHTGYHLSECQHQVAILRRVLQRINGDTLGPWTWVLVRSEDWKPLLRRIGTRLDTPAFSSLQQRETFLEGALFGPEPLRAAELAREFQVPIDQLLELAVAHEMGHAICHGGDEGVANRVGQQLRNGRMPACDAARP
jgi:hypothetical protein